MTRIATILMLILSAALATADTVTDSISYTLSVTNINSTNYTTLIGVTETNIQRQIPVSGIKISNTNSADTTTVSVVWSDEVAGFSFSLDQIDVVGPTGVHWLTANPIDLSNTGTVIKAKLDATNSVPIDFSIWHYDATIFTP